MKIHVGVNTLTTVDTEIYGNHSQFWTYNVRQHPDWRFTFYHPRRASVDNMRNEAARQALDSECDYLMFIDDDVLVKPQVLDVLLSRKKEIIGALTFLRSYPFDPMFFTYIYAKNGHKLMDKYKEYEEHIDAEGLVKCDAVGFSCVLIDCSLLKKVSTPYFVTSRWHTEDTYFCIKAKEENPDLEIFIDTTVSTGHLLDKEAVSVLNVKALRKYYEEVYPDLAAKLSQQFDRSPEAIEAMLAKLGA